MLFIHPIGEIVNVIIYQEDMFRILVNYFIGDKYHTVIVYHGNLLLNCAICFYLKLSNAVVHLISVTKIVPSQHGVEKHSVVTRLQVGWCGIQILAGAQYFLLQNICTGRSSSSLVLSGYQGSFSLVKWPGCETDCSPVWCEVKNWWSCTSSLLICLHGVDRNNFTFTIIAHLGSIFYYLLYCVL